MGKRLQPTANGTTWGALGTGLWFAAPRIPKEASVLLIFGVSSAVSVVWGVF